MIFTSKETEFADTVKAGFLLSILSVAVTSGATYLLVPLVLGIRVD